MFNIDVKKKREQKKPIYNYCLCI